VFIFWRSCRWQVDLLGQLTGLYSLTLHGNPLETKGDGSSGMQRTRVGGGGRGRGGGAAATARPSARAAKGSMLVQFNGGVLYRHRIILALPRLKKLDFSAVSGAGAPVGRPAQLTHSGARN
jgi:hypothetical protein